MKHAIEYFFVKALFLIAGVLTFRGAMRLGRGLGRFIYRVFPFRKQVVMTNLRAAFPNKTPEELETICRDTYAFLCMLLFEYLKTFSIPRDRIKEMVVFDPPDLMNEIYDEGNGLIVFTGHFGSFELMGAAFHAMGMTCDGVAKAMKNEKVDRFLDDIRAKNGLNVIKKKDGFDKVIDSIERGHIIALVADQDAGDRGTVVKFLGIDSSTPVGPAVASIRTGVRIVAPFIVREGLDSYKVFVHEVPLNNLPEDMDGKINEIMQRCTFLLERYVREYPDHYLWLHKRWKTAGLYNK